MTALAPINVAAPADEVASAMTTAARTAAAVTAAKHFNRKLKENWFDLAIIKLHLRKRSLIVNKLYCLNN
jgi:uncharacterized membrane protein